MPRPEAPFTFFKGCIIFALSHFLGNGEVGDAKPFIFTNDVSKGSAGCGPELWGKSVELWFEARLEEAEGGLPGVGQSAAPFQPRRCSGGEAEAALRREAGAVLGPVHWVTARLDFLRFRRVAKQIGGLGPEIVPPNENL